MISPEIMQKGQESDHFKVKILSLNLMPSEIIFQKCIRSFPSKKKETETSSLRPMI